MSVACESTRVVFDILTYLHGGVNDIRAERATSVLVALIVDEFAAEVPSAR